MRSQYPPRGRRCGTLLIAAALLVACAAAADSLRAQSERLDRNQQAFPAAPAGPVRWQSGARRPGERRAISAQRAFRVMRCFRNQAPVLNPPTC